MRKLQSQRQEAKRLRGVVTELGRMLDRQKHAQEQQDEEMDLVHGGILFANSVNNATLSYQGVCWARLRIVSLQTVGGAVKVVQVSLLDDTLIRHVALGKRVGMLGAWDLQPRDRIAVIENG